MSPTNVLILGATGYVGGSILLELLNHGHAGSSITALVRSSEKARTLEALNLGIKVTEGTPNDAALLVTLTREADVIIDAYNSDDMVGTANLLSGCKAKFDATGRPTSIIHVSGVGIVTDTAMGRPVPNRVWDDANVEEMAGLPIENVHRNVDLEFLKADQEGYIVSYLLIPGAIFGDVNNVLTEAGIQRANAVVFTATIQPVVVLNGVSATIGGGYNSWSIVDIQDVASLTVLIFNQLSTAPHGAEGFYFAENGDVEMRWIAKVAADVVHGAGSNAAVEERALTKEELDMFFPGAYATYIPALSANTRCKGSRGRALGWKPQRGVSELKRDIETLTRLALQK